MFRSSARFELMVDDHCLDGTVVPADSYWRQETQKSAAPPFAEAAQYAIRRKL